MLKGKFYTGLPEKMMNNNRSRGLDRQQTNFYWPDESEINDSQTSKTKRRTERMSVERQVANNDDVDVKAKDRFQKQLTSGIEFYDNVDAKTPEARRRRLKKIDNVNLNNSVSQYQPEKKKLETFTSKIEFYDYVDDFKPKNNNSVKKVASPVTKNNIKDESVNKSVDNSKKRITFQPNSVEKTKSILKNNDVKNPPRRGLMLSKSVGNISKLAKSCEDLTKKENESEKPQQLSKIIRDVKNLNLSNDKPQTQLKIARHDDDDDYYPKKGEPDRIRNKRIDDDRYDDYNDFDRKSTNRRGRDLDEDRILKKRIEDDRVPRRNIDRDPISKKRLDDEYSARPRYEDDDPKYSRSNRSRVYDDHYDDYPNDRLGKRVNGDSPRYSRRNQYNDDYDNRRQISPRDTPPRNRRREYLDEERIYKKPDTKRHDLYDNDTRPSYREPVKRPEYDDVDDYSRRSARHNGHYEEGSRTKSEPKIVNRGMVKELSRKSEDNDDRFDDYDSKPNKRVENGISRDSDRSNRSNDTAERNYVPPSRNRYQQNLRSNIFFDDDAPAQPNRPLTVRSSAVCRVGVGLPDI